VAPYRPDGTLSPPWHSLKYDRAAECLIKDREALLAFYDFRLSAGNICADCLVNPRLGSLWLRRGQVTSTTRTRGNASHRFCWRSRHQLRRHNCIGRHHASEYTALDQPSQYYQHCRQTENCHCDKYHSVGWHVRQKLDHLLSPLQSPNARRTTPKIASMTKGDREKAALLMCAQSQ
jgi:hypothetical protein